MPDKCPWCEASRPTENIDRWWYECGTNVEYPDARRYECFKRELQRTKDDMQSTIDRMQPVVDAVTAMIAIDKEHRFQALAEVIEAGEKYQEGK